MSLALPTAASKMSGMLVPSCLRIEKPAMWCSGLSPALAASAGLIAAAEAHPDPLPGAHPRVAREWRSCSRL